jgi:hypothetical protein
MTCLLKIKSATLQFDVGLRAVSVVTLIMLASTQGQLLSAPNWTRASLAFWWWLGALPILLAQLVFRPRIAVEPVPSRWWQLLVLLERTPWLRRLFWVQVLLFPACVGAFAFFTDQILSFGRWNGLVFVKGMSAYLSRALMTWSSTAYTCQCWSTALASVKYLMIGALDALKVKPRRNILTFALILFEVLFYLPLFVLVGMPLLSLVGQTFWSNVSE